MGYYQSYGLVAYLIVRQHCLVPSHSLTTHSQSVLVSTAVLYALFTGSGTQFNLGGFLEELSPYTFAMVGVALNIGLSVAGAGW
jgi:V-type H+-transporting ATPase proteolipid subunit